MYTKIEKTVKRHSDGFVYKQARDVLIDRGINQVCVNALRGKNGYSFTTKEASELIEEVIQDSIFYSSH